MSTICKLDPMVRRERFARANAIRSLARTIPQIPTERRTAALMVLGFMREYRADPSLTGREKSHCFSALLKSLQPVSTLETTHGEGHQTHR